MNEIVKRPRLLSLLQFNHFGDELGMMREIGIHNNDKFTARVFNAVNVGRA